MNATPKTGQDEAFLRMQIRLNEMLPPHLRCDDAIAEMKLKLARLQRAHLKIVEK
jgi:hypothetical protein